MFHNWHKKIEPLIDNYYGKIETQLREIVLLLKKTELINIKNILKKLNAPLAYKTSIWNDY